MLADKLAEVIADSPSTVVPVSGLWRKFLRLAWSPLPITEVGIAGHQDVIGTLLLTAAILLMTHNRARACALTLAAAALTKGFPILLLPMFMRKFGSRFAIFAGLCLLYLNLPLWVYLPEFLHGMKQYLGYVHVNSGAFNSLNTLLAYVTAAHFDITNRLCDLAILLAVFWSVRTPVWDSKELIRRSIVVLATCLLSVPTLFPWYILWLLPLAVIVHRRPPASFILLSGTVSLIYTYYLYKTPIWWVPLVEYVPFYLVLLWELHTGYWRPAIRAGSAAKDVLNGAAAIATSGSQINLNDGLSVVPQVETA